MIRCVERLYMIRLIVAMLMSYSCSVNAVFVLRGVGPILMNASLLQRGEMSAG